jgi:ferredoxin-NADP reductase
MSAPTTLLSKHPVAEGTMAFHFTRPDGFAFVPGQAVEVLLGAGATDGAPLGHAFSIVSAPHENEVVVATRLRDSAYKQALRALSPGDAAQLDGPFGTLTLDEADAARPVVLIAGGIGITPFVSILRDAAQRRRAQRLVLVYSNRRPEDAAYLEELQALAATLPSFTLQATMTGMERSHAAWTGRRGRIDADMLASVSAGAPARLWYVAGPPGLVAAARMALDDLRVPERDQRVEEFEGY